MLEPTPGSTAPSYAALLRVPGFGRVVLGTLLARLGGQMWEIVLVLFVLQRYQSAGLAGLTVLLSILPGLVLSPVAGALLDRQGRIRLMILDYAATAGVGALIVALSLGHRLPPPLLLLIVSGLGVSNILSITGARSLLPLIRRGVQGRVPVATARIDMPPVAPPPWRKQDEEALKRFLAFSDLQ